MRYFIILLLCLLLTGCRGAIENNSEGNSELSKNTEVEENTEKNTEIETDTETENTEDVGVPVIDDGKEPEFVITLPANASVGEKIIGEHEWKIDVEGYDPLDYYPYTDHPESLTISAGWVMEYEGQYMGNALGNPYIPWNHSEFKNHETIENKYTYICEYEAENYIGNVCIEHDVTVQDGMSYYWCLIFIDPSAPKGTTSDWVFLNKTCFTKEQALDIAETYQPSWK